MSSFDPRYLLVTLMCVTGATVSSYLLYRDFISSAGHGSGEPMAKIERIDGGRRKRASSFVWRNARPGEPLFSRDSIRTGAGDSAAIRMQDGRLIELGENSLVVIDETKHLALEALHGAVVLHTQEGDKRIEPAKDGNVSVTELAIRLSKPETSARYFVAERAGKALGFSWKMRPARDAGARKREAELANGLSLQIAKDRQFRTWLRVVPIKTPRAQQAGPYQFEKGTYFWRLVANSKPVTETSHFNVIAVPAPEPIAPSGGQRISIYAADTLVPFKWSNIELASEIEELARTDLEISAHSNFAELAASHRIRISDGAVSLPGVVPGTYYWRIKIEYGDFRTLSRTERFEVAKASRPELVLDYPTHKALVQKVRANRLVWKTEVSADLEYRVDVRRPGQDDPISLTTKSTSIALDSFSPGPYSWRVAAVKSDGQEIVTTDWSTFTVVDGPRLIQSQAIKTSDVQKFTYGPYGTLPAPIVLAPPEGAAYSLFQKSAKPLLRWQAVTGAKSYEVELYQAGHLTMSTTTRTEISLPDLKVGEYLWGVRAIDPTRRKGIATSLRPFTVRSN